MRYAMICSAILVSATLGTQAFATPTISPDNSTKPATPPPAALHHSPTTAVQKYRAAPASSRTVTYNRDSPNPNVGWHTRGGLRVCTDDCDNPEIPGSGYTCKNVQFLGMPMRECDSSSW